MITVILTEDVAECGSAGQVCTVSDGYARNFLLRRGYAVAATKKQIAEYESRAEREEKKKEEKKEKSAHIVKLLDGKTITISAKHDHQTLFAAIDEKAIAQELTKLIDENVPVAIIKIAQPIKKIGKHNVALDFGEKVTAQIIVNVTEA